MATTPRCRSAASGSVKMLLLCGTLPKNFNTPFRLFGGGHIELLRYIADLSVMWATPTGCPSR